MNALKLSSMILVLAASTAYAEKGKLEACEGVKKACEAGGYKPGDHKKGGKGLWIDCVGSAAAGKPVEGVTISQADAQACIDAHKARRAEKKAK